MRSENVTNQLDNPFYVKLQDLVRAALNMQHERPNDEADPEGDTKVVLDAIWPEIERTMESVAHIVKHYDDIPEDLEWDDALWGLMYAVHVLADEYHVYVLGDREENP